MVGDVVKSNRVLIPGSQDAMLEGLHAA